MRREIKHPSKGDVDDRFCLELGAACTVKESRRSIQASRHPGSMTFSEFRVTSLFGNQNTRRINKSRVHMRTSTVLIFSNHSIDCSIS